MAIMSECRKSPIIYCKFHSENMLAPILAIEFSQGGGLSKYQVMSFAPK